MTIMFDLLLELEESPATAKPRTSGLHAGCYRIADNFDAALPDSFWLGEDPAGEADAV